MKGRKEPVLVYEATRRSGNPPSKLCQRKTSNILLVGGLKQFVFGRIIPTDQYFSEGLKPTSLSFPIVMLHYWRTKLDNIFSLRIIFTNTHAIRVENRSSLSSKPSLYRRKTSGFNLWHMIHTHTHFVCRFFPKKRNFRKEGFRKIFKMT